MTKETARYILITGAAGTGTTTLADALAKELSATHLEADDFCGCPVTRPICIWQTKRYEESACYMKCALMTVQWLPDQ
jgi:hypothetical protein